MLCMSCEIIFLSSYSWSDGLEYQFTSWEREGDAVEDSDRCVVQKPRPDSWVFFEAKESNTCNYGIYAIHWYSV